MIRGLRLLVLMAIGALPVSQAVPFTNACLSVVDGRIAELERIVAGYAERAANADRSLDDYILYFQVHTDTLVQGEGVAMRVTVNRLADLRELSATVGETAPILRPLLVAGRVDTETLRLAADRYDLGVPLSVSGLAYGAIGAAIMLIFGAVPGWLFRGKRRRVRA